MASNGGRCFGLFLLDEKMLDARSFIIYANFPLLTIFSFARLVMAMQKKRKRRSEFHKSGNVERFPHNVIATKDLL